jgi:hypothetical protein
LDLTDNRQNAAFWSLIQHHGYPTPLLDWSYSPFVAAYFAFHGANAKTDKKVRIFEFDRQSWQADFRQMGTVHPLPPHFTLLESLPLENERAIPQQAISTVTNVDDVETYIRECEKIRGKSYLRVFELSADEAMMALRDLRLMGITQGSLFPGLEGTCRELAFRKFGAV